MEQEYSECRTCGVRAPKENMESIFSSQDVALKFKTLLSLNLVLDRRLPEFLCKPCVMELNLTYDFITKALSMQKKHLDQIFKAKENLEETRIAEKLAGVNKEDNNTIGRSGAAETNITNITAAKEKSSLKQTETLVTEAGKVPEIVDIDDERSSSPPTLVQQPPAQTKPQLKLKPISSLMKPDIPTQQVQPTVQANPAIQPDFPTLHHCNNCKLTYRGTMKQYKQHKSKCLPASPVVVPKLPTPNDQRKYILINKVAKKSTAQVPPNTTSQPIRKIPSKSNPITKTCPNIVNGNTYQIIPGQSTIHPGNLVNTIRISRGMSTSADSTENTLHSEGRIGMLPAPSQNNLNSIKISSGETVMSSGNVDVSALVANPAHGATINILNSESTLITTPPSTTPQTTSTPSATHTQPYFTRPVRPACALPFRRQLPCSGSLLRVTRFPLLMNAVANPVPMPESSSNVIQPVSVNQLVPKASSEVIPVETSAFVIDQERTSQKSDHARDEINQTPNVVALMSLWNNPDLSHCSMFEEEWQTSSLLRNALDGICECSVCRIIFLSETEYRQHYIYELNRKMWMHRFWFCTACKINFSSQRLLDEHFKIGLHGNLKEQYTCSLCPLFSSKRENVMRHMLKMHSFCPHCHTNLQRARAEAIKDKKSSLDPRHCISCGLLVNRSSDFALKRCFEVPESEKMSICNICSVSFSSVDALVTHFFINHNELFKDGMFKGPNIQNVRPYVGKDPPFVEEETTLDDQECIITENISKDTTSPEMEVELTYGKEEVLDVEEMDVDNLTTQFDSAVSLYCCISCSASYPIFLDLMMHINAAHFVPFYTCGRCGRNFRNMIDSLPHDCTIEDNVKLQLVRVEDLLD